MLVSLRLRIIATLLLGALLTCARHPTSMLGVRKMMAREDYDKALEEMDEQGRSEDDVLYLLEKGLLLHYAGEYEQSNTVFERAERLSEDLYTKSISRETAALLTSDLVLKYVPKPFEQILINYFRALNYMFLGAGEDALVECRKASQKLTRYSEDDKRPFRQDAFIEYITGILYEWGDETNDAFISYANARKAYETYSALFGISEPPFLACDIIRTASSLGFGDEIEKTDSREQERCRRQSDDRRLSKVVIFIEHGFVPAKQELSINIPILKSEDEHARGSPYEFSLGVASRMHGHTFSPDEISYFLRVALPSYPDYFAEPVAPTVFVDTLAMHATITEDIFAVARTEFDHDMPKIFAKTLARALIKYKATDKAEDKLGWFFGKIVNIFTASTEQADLRAWLSLPRAIYTTIVYVEPGTHTMSLEPPYIGDDDRRPSHEIRLVARPGSTNFIRFRTY